MKLLLIRHAQSEGNAAHIIQGRADYPLTPLGRRQARRLAGRLTAEFKGITAIYASSQSRAVETAEILADALAVSVTPDDRLTEYDMGELTGLTLDEVEERYPEVYAAWTADVEDWINFPGSEPHERFHRRVGAAFADIVAGHDGDETVVVVSHGGTLGTYLIQALDLPRGRRHPFYFDNTSVTIVDLSRRRPRLVRHNDTHHLRDLGGAS
jgi:broad specificity phosphatase PhoE